MIYPFNQSFSPLRGTKGVGRESPGGPCFKSYIYTGTGEILSGKLDAVRCFSCLGERWVVLMDRLRFETGRTGGFEASETDEAGPPGRDFRQPDATGLSQRGRVQAGDMERPEVSRGA